MAASNSIKNKGRALVVFYSRTGVTKKVAQAISKALKCDIDDIKDMKDRSGAKGYLLGGRDAMKRNLTEIDHKKDPAGYGLVIIGTPVWAFTMAPAVRTYVSEHKASLKKLAFFCTMDGSGGDRAVEHLEALAGKKSAASLVLLSREVMKAELKETYDGKLGEFISKLKK